MMDVPNNKSLSKKFKSSKDHNNDISKTLKTPHTAAKAIQEDLRQDWHSLKAQADNNYIFIAAKRVKGIVEPTEHVFGWRKNTVEGPTGE